MTEPTLARDEAAALVAVQAPPADRHPAAVHVASLAPGSRRTMRQALVVIAGLLRVGRAGAGAPTIRHGKGRRERIMYATNGAREALTAWLTVRGADEGPLFTPVDKSGRIIPGRLTPESVFDRLEHLARRAGVARFSPHDCR